MGNTAAAAKPNSSEQGLFLCIIELMGNLPTRCAVILACGGCILEFVLEIFFCGKNLSHFEDLEWCSGLWHVSQNYDVHKL